MSSGRQNVPKIQIFHFSSSLVSLKSSESDHIAPTWSTHEYYGLRKFQSDRNTLTSKKISVFDSGGRWVEHVGVIRVFSDHSKDIRELENLKIWIWGCF